jgi:hypothetical protein
MASGSRWTDLRTQPASLAITQIRAGMVAEAVTEVAELTALGANATGLANWNAGLLHIWRARFQLRYEFLEILTLAKWAEVAVFGHVGGILAPLRRH